jgi:hypothetical protein
MSGCMMDVLINGQVRGRSTEAARAYVLLTRDRMQAERARVGERVVEQRSFQRLVQSISSEALASTWPDADLEAALAE